MALTQQEIFDKAWLGLKAQGFKHSRTKRDGILQCAYRGRGGRRCAIGHCIPDDAYTRKFEGRHAANPEILAILGSEHSIFAINLQDCHDRAITPQEMEDNLRAFAAERNLTIPESRLTLPPAGRSPTRP